MADNGFNGTTISIGGSDQADLRDLNVSCDSAQVPVSGSAATSKKYEAGIPDYTITYTVVGITSLSNGDEGAAVVAWNDGGSFGSLTNCVVVNVADAGSEDGEILTNITVKETDA